MDKPNRASSIVYEKREYHLNRKGIELQNKWHSVKNKAQIMQNVLKIQ
jgi:hypothetical protein